MTFDNTTISMLMAAVTSAGLFLNAIVHWDKIRPVVFSHTASVVIQNALMFGCFWFGHLAIIVGANVFALAAYFDFVRTCDGDCRRIGAMIYTTAIGLFNFAIQFALAVN